MNKKTKLLITVGIVLFTIVIFIINILLKKNEKEPVSFPQRPEESVYEEVGPVQKGEQPETSKEVIEEFPIPEGEPLLF